MTPDYSVETLAMAGGARRVAGVDEAGRGPLAGPVTAAAVVLDPQNIPDGLNDSKKLTAARRDALAAWIMVHCDWSVAHVDPVEIDALNILRASHVAMCRALAGLRGAGMGVVDALPGLRRGFMRQAAGLSVSPMPRMLAGQAL